MLLILSPAKRLDEAPARPDRSWTTPVLEQESLRIVEKLKALPPAKLRTLLAASPALAALNHARYANWSDALRKPAVLLYDGETYRGLGAAALDPDDLRFAQRHLRLLSGLYGVLRPLDRIAPYRLEMATRLSMGRNAKDLYAFWGDRISGELRRAMLANGDEVLVNLASEEYGKAVRADVLGLRMVTPRFKERTAAGLRTSAMYAKHQRGAMARWIIQRRVLDPEAIKSYRNDGYGFDAEGSTEGEWLFVREAAGGTGRGTG